jgi:hypothetical protein
MIKVHRRLGITNDIDFEFLLVCCADTARALYSDLSEMVPRLLSFYHTKQL